MMKTSRNERGGALLGAMMAVTMMALLGAALVTYYDSFVRQSRQAYVRSLMTNVDNKIRFMAMQPYAYTCADQRTGSVADQIAGLHSCVINRAYFANLEHVLIPGAPCPNHADCGLKLQFLTSAGDPPLNFVSRVNPNTNETEDTALFPYRLEYEGTDFKLSFGGYDLTAADAGMAVPREILQSQAFDCAYVNPKKPVFGGFDVAGKPICRGWNECDAGGTTGEYGTSFSFRQLNGADLAFKCKKLRDHNMIKDCQGGGQRKITRINYSNGEVSGDCADLPVPLLDAPYAATAVMAGGACGPANGVAATAPPTAGLCAGSTASPVSGTGPYTWTCTGADDSVKNCSTGGAAGLKWVYKYSQSANTFISPATGPLAGAGPQHGTINAVALSSGPADCPMPGIPAGTPLDQNNLGPYAGGACATEGSVCKYNYLESFGVYVIMTPGWYLQNSEWYVCQNGPSGSGHWSGNYGAGVPAGPMPNCPWAGILMGPGIDTAFAAPCTPVGSYCLGAVGHAYQCN